MSKFIEYSIYNKSPSLSGRHFPGKRLSSSMIALTEIEELAIKGRLFITMRELAIRDKTFYNNSRKATCGL